MTFLLGIVAERGAGTGQIAKRCDLRAWGSVCTSG